MGRHGSRRPSINTSADAVLRRLDHEFDTERGGIREFVRAHLQWIALGAIITGAVLVTAAMLAPVTVIVVGIAAMTTGAVLATLVEDEDRVTGIGRIRRRCRRGIRRMFGSRRPRSRERSATIACRVAPWLFPDPRRPGR